MLQALSSMNKITQLHTDPDSPVIPKGHKKQVNIWDRGTAKPETQPNLADYPSDAEMEAAWGKGLQEAQQMRSKLGTVRYCFVSELNRVNFNSKVQSRMRSRRSVRIKIQKLVMNFKYYIHVIFLVLLTAAIYTKELI